MLIRPQTPHYYHSEEGVFINDWFHSDGEDMEDFIKRINFPVETIIPVKNPRGISKKILDLCGLLRYNDDLIRELIDCELRGLFMHIARDYRQGNNPRKYMPHYTKLHQLRNEIYSSPVRFRNVAQLAAKVNLSVSYFQHVYKDLFDISAGEDLIESRLQYAKYLLSSSIVPVSEVAAQCGYENDVHFIRQFKSRVGITPRRYRVRYLPEGAG